jgi:DNA modification methylase
MIEAILIAAGVPADLAKSLRSIDLRTVTVTWRIATQPCSGAHFADMLLDLTKRCIKADGKPEDTVLNLLSGAGTTGLVADCFGRFAVVEVNPGHQALGPARTSNDATLFAQVAAA